MSAPVIVPGTIKADGTLELTQQPNLPPGPVRVTVEPLSPSASEDWWQCMQRARKELEAINYPTMTAHEVESYVQWLRGDDDRIEAVYRQMTEERRRREQSGC